MINKKLANVNNLDVSPVLLLKKKLAIYKAIIKQFFYYIVQWKSENTNMLIHGGMIEKEIQRFFISAISIYSSSFFFLYINDFLIVWNQDTFRILSSIAFETVKIHREQNQKSMLSGQSFSVNR